MKNISIAAIFLLAFIIPSVKAQTLLFSEGFETDGEGSRYTSTTFVDCANSDYFLRTNTNPVTPPSCGTLFGSTLTNLQGSYFWASEDIIGGGGTCNGCRAAGTITSQAINISGYNTLSVSLFLATSNNTTVRWENADSINIKASIDGGAFVTVGRFMGKNAAAFVPDHLGIDANLNGMYEPGIDPATDCDVINFTQYSFSIPGSGSVMQIKIVFNQQGGTEELAIDQIEVRGVAVPCTNPTIPVLSASSSTICNGASTNLSVNSGTLNSATNWQWYSGSCGGTSVGAGTSINVSPTATTVYYARGEGGCVSPGTCGSITITVNSAPATPGAIAGTTTICSGSSNTYSVAPVSGATGYNWTLPPGWTGSSSTNLISTTAGATSGNVSVTATNSCGTSAVSSQAITVNSAPATPGSVSGNTTVCESAVNTYSVAPVSGAASYSWTLPSGWTGSSTTNTISATSGSTGGNIGVRAINACGNSAPSTVSITVENNVAITINPTATNLCSPNAAYFDVTATGSNLTYQWQVDQGSGFINMNDDAINTGTNTSSLSVAPTSFSMNGYTYRCIISGSCGSPQTSAAALLTIYAPVTVTTQPLSFNACDGGNATFSAQATGSSGQIWQISTNNGLSWSNLSNGGIYSGVTTTTLTLTGVSASMDAYLYRCRFSGTCSPLGKFTNAAQLNVYPIFNQNMTATICNGDSYILGSQTLTASGSYSETFTTINGCDSIVNLTLTVNPGFNQNMTATICNGDSYILGSQTLTASGSYSETFTTINGCDSIVNLTLTVNPGFNQNISASICSGDSYTLGSQTLTASGLYSETFTTITGCDSIVNLTLTVNPGFNQNVTASICNGDSYTLGSQTLTASGSYSETFTTINGCDSIVNLSLTVNTVNISVTQMQDTLISAATSATYQWYDCSLNTIITGETGQQFIATANGDYAVIVEENSCTDTSTCININVIGIEKNTNTLSAVVFPNPFSDMISVFHRDNISSGKIEIFDLAGRRLIVEEMNENTQTINTSSLSSGIYLIRISTHKGILLQKLIKE